MMVGNGGVNVGQINIALSIRHYKNGVSIQQCSCAVPHSERSSAAPQRLLVAGPLCIHRTASARQAPAPTWVAMRSPESEPRLSGVPAEPAPHRGFPGRT
jgi:hypothetical protein